MSWDKKQRGGEQRYYYRSKRSGGKTTKVYIGKGPLAELTARLDEEERERRQAERRAWLDEQIRLAAADASLDDLRDSVDLLFRATLLLGGYHNHHGLWRRRRNRDRSVNS